MLISNRSGGPKNDQLIIQQFQPSTVVISIQIPQH